MARERSRTSLAERIRTPATWAGEAIFIVAVIVLGLIMAGALIGLNPLSSPIVIVALLVIAVIVIGRTRWYRRNREEIQRGGAEHARRERRGF
jgi:hypothetical protein